MATGHGTAADGARFVPSVHGCTLPRAVNFCAEANTYLDPAGPPIHGHASAGKGTPPSTNTSGGGPAGPWTHALGSFKPGAQRRIRFISGPHPTLSLTRD